MFASIILLTRQAGPYLERLLPMLFSQVAPEPYEVIAVDSGSTDGTIEQFRRWPVRLQQIPPREFGFGRTKNQAAALARGRALVFLSQDALPVGPRWLATLVGNLEAPNVAGSYGRQLPWPHTAPPQWYFLETTYPPRRLVRRGSSVASDGVAFSNANAAIRRDVWERFPFDESLLMSEDQDWAPRGTRSPTIQPRRCTMRIATRCSASSSGASTAARRCGTFCATLLVRSALGGSPISGASSSIL